MIDPLLDQIVEGWHVLLKVGQGSSGSVYEARRGEARAALKVIHLDGVSTHGAARFEREVQLLAELEHDHIVRCLGAGSGEGFLFVVLEFLDGGSLDRQLHQRSRLSVPETVGIGQAVAAALTVAHAAGIVHRDIKPANLLLDASGTVKLADFNLARRQAVDQEITTTGTIVGTPHYMAPEQVDAGEVGPPADLYALGALLYHLVAGHPPYEGSSSLAVLQKHLKSDVPDLSAEVSHAPQALSDLISTLMAKDPGSRPDAAATLARLASLETEPLELVEVPQPHYSQRPLERGDDESDSREGLSTSRWKTFNLEPTKQVGSTASKRWQGGPGTSSVDLLASKDDEPQTDILSRIESVVAGEPPCAPARPLPRGRPWPTVDALTLLVLAALGLALYDGLERARGQDMLAAPLGGGHVRLDALRAAFDLVPPWVWALLVVILLVDRILARLRRYGLWSRALFWLRFSGLRLLGRREAAAEVLEQLGHREAAGRLLRRAGLFREAAGYYEATGRFEEQAELLLEAGSRDGALAAYRAAGTPRAYFNAGLLGDTSRVAADALLERGEVEWAATAHLRAGRPLDAGDVLERAGRLEDATQALETAFVALSSQSSGAEPLPAPQDLARRIAGLHLELDALERGAEWFEAAGDFEAAGGLYLRMGQPLGRARCLSAAVPPRGKLDPRQQAQLREAARLYAEAQDPAGVPLFVRLNDFDSAGELSRSLGDDVQAAQHFARAGRPHEGALSAERAGNRSLAAYLFRESGHHRRAVELYRELGQLEDAAETARQAGDPALKAELLELLGDYLGAAQGLLALSQDDAAGELLAQVPEDHGDYPQAMLLAGELHHAAGRYRLASRVYALGLPEGPVSGLSAAGPTLRFAESLEHVGDLEDALEVLGRFRGTPLAPPDLRQREARLEEALVAENRELPRRPPSGAQRSTPPPPKPRSSRSAMRRRPGSGPGDRSRPASGPGDRSRPASGPGDRSRPASGRSRPASGPGDRSRPASGPSEREARAPIPPPSQPLRRANDSAALPSPGPSPARGRPPRNNAEQTPSGRSGSSDRPPLPPPSRPQRRGPLTSEPQRPGSDRYSPAEVPRSARPGSGRVGARRSPSSGSHASIPRRESPARDLVETTLGAGSSALQLERWAGQTAAAWVYAARQGRTEVTVKVLRPELATDERRRAWSGLASRPQVAGTPRVTGGGAATGQPAYLVYESATGEGLDRALARGDLKLDERQSIVYELLTILGEAHAAGLSHLDLRPSKVRQGERGLFVLDLGHLAALGADAPLRDLLDPRYTAPEQAAGSLGNAQADVYQLGLLSCKVLLGRLPFSAPRAEEFWNLHLDGQPDLSAAEGLTRTVLEQALARDPTERFATALEFRQALFADA